MRSRLTRSITIISKSPEVTFSIGKIIGAKARSGQVIALSGELGSGKTCFTQGLAAGLSIPDSYQITSPTFTLINEYPGRLKLTHIDLYRLSGTRDLEEIGYEEYFYGEGVAVIEWAEKALDILPAERIDIEFKFISDTSRELIISGDSEYISALKGDLEKEM